MDYRLTRNSQKFGESVTFCPTFCSSPVINGTQLPITLQVNACHYPPEREREEVIKDSKV